jgi:DNA repair photolyase
MNWNKVEISTECGETVLAQTPVIISASRSTDIPTFYGDWFVDRWKASYLKWINPFNRVPLYVSFKNTRVVVFWTKNPKPFFKHIDFLDKNIPNYYFQYTLNDYDKEGFEGKVPRLETRIKIFKELSSKIGKDRVVWRFDPLLLTSELTVNDLLLRVENIGNQLYNYTSKLIFSFADISIYNKVANNLKRENIDYKEFTSETMIQFAEGIQKLNEKWNLEIATSAEKFDLKNYGISHNKCMYDDLMIKLFSHDKILMEFLGVEYVEPSLFDTGKVEKVKKLKDKGQREACGCIMSKDIGEYNTCPHECVYCYANTSKELALKNYKNHTSNPKAETIVSTVNLNIN